MPELNSVTVPATEPPPQYRGPYGKPLAPALVSNVWKKGQTGNPGGRTIEFAECQRMAREKSPRAMERLIELMESKDERVALMACDKVLERAWGKPKEQKDHSALSNLPPAEQRERVQQLLNFAASIQVPNTVEEIEHEPSQGVQTEPASDRLQR